MKGVGRGTSYRAQASWVMKLRLFAAGSPNLYGRVRQCEAEHVAANGPIKLTREPGMAAGSGTRLYDRSRNLRSLVVSGGRADDAGDDFRASAVSGQPSLLPVHAGSTA